jgi:serine protease Do
MFWYHAAPYSKYSGGLVPPFDRNPPPMRLFRSKIVRATLVVLAALFAAPLVPGPGARPAIARTAPESFADLAAKLLPSVVNISTSANAPPRAGLPEMPGLPPGSPFEQFFKDFMERNRPPGTRPPGSAPGSPPGPNPREGQPQRPEQPERRTQSLGSGFIIDPSGLIVTNNHVIDGADEITVTLSDNTVLKATLVGRDERVDVALLQVKSEKPLPAVPFADSSGSRVGDWVLAIGNPFGLGGTVTAGIVSALQRDIRSGPYDDFIQTDAAINQGNSGGPLFNMNGEVIGINTAIFSRSGGSIGIGFAVPANLAKIVVAQLREFGHARRGWLGVRIQQVTPDIAESVGLHEPGGAMIAGVNEDGPADRAKIRPGDIVIRFNNQDVKEMRNLPRIVAETTIGQEVPVVVWRDGKEITVTVTVGQLPDEHTVAGNTPDKPDEATRSVEIAGLGVQVAPITAATRDKFQLADDQKGVVITEVAAGSAAAERGLKPGDVIVEVQQEAVNTPADVQKRLEAVRKQSRRSVLMLVQGRDGRHWVPLPLSADGKPQRQPG